jgi:hypothetical protein
MLPSYKQSNSKVKVVITLYTLFLVFSENKIFASIAAVKLTCQQLKIQLSNIYAERKLLNTSG